jgi:hypothetical protein
MPCIHDSKIGFPLPFFLFLLYIFKKEVLLKRGYPTIDLHHLSAFQIHVNNLATPTPTSSSNCLNKGNPPRLMIPANIPYYVLSRNKQTKKLQNNEFYRGLLRDIQKRRLRYTHKNV